MTEQPTRTAFVIPDDPAQPTSTITWTEDDELLDLLYKTIGCSVVDVLYSVPIDGAPDELSVWASEDAEHLHTAVANERYQALACGLGYPHMQHLFGAAVLTGGAHMDGVTDGLAPEVVSALRMVLDTDEAATR